MQNIKILALLFLYLEVYYNWKAVNAVLCAFNNVMCGATKWRILALLIIKPGGGIVTAMITRRFGTPKLMIVTQSVARRLTNADNVATY
jgi:hypothetical protein